jgi:hypothetical protein
MKPPRIVYLLSAFALTGLILSLRRSEGSSGLPIATVIGAAVLFLFFLYFAVKRFNYDRLPTGKTTGMTMDFEIAQDESLQLFQVEASNSVKVLLKLNCKLCEPDECFPLRMLDNQGRVVVEDEFIPAFGRYRFETKIEKECLPLRVVIKNTLN